MDHREEILKQKDELLTEIADINGQLEMARSYQRVTGQWADPMWYASAKRAVAIKTGQLRKLDMLLTQEKKAYSRTLSDLFVECARESMPSAHFNELMELAKRRHCKLRE